MVRRANVTYIYSRDRRWSDDRTSRRPRGGSRCGGVSPKPHPHFDNWTTPKEMGRGPPRATANPPPHTLLARRSDPSAQLLSGALRAA